MKTLYLECNMGAAGDMLMAALYELAGDRQAFIEKMNALGLPDISVSAEKAEKCGIQGTHMKVLACGVEERSEDVDAEHVHSHEHGHDHSHGHTHDHEEGHEHGHEHHHDHVHRGFKEICEIIDGLDVSDKVRTDAKAVYGLLAEAESAVHGRPVEEVHFHEVGSLDALADIVGVCMLMETIGAERIEASAVHVGSGNVRCAHGILPVPAPAAAYLLKGIPIYQGSVKGELCTPTGAALLKYFAKSFGSMPAMKVSAIGCGMGSKDFPQANCVRAFLGETEDAAVKKADKGLTGSVVKLECNLDDMSGEDLGYAMDVLFKAGARDVFWQAIGMKKSRPGILLSVICLPKEADDMAALMLKHTTTIGVRRLDMKRYNLRRSIETVDTKFGPLRIKRSEGFGVTRAKAENADLVRMADENGLSLEELRQQLGAELDQK